MANAARLTTHVFTGNAANLEQMRRVIAGRPLLASHVDVQVDGSGLRVTRNDRDQSARVALMHLAGNLGVNLDASWTV